MKKLQKLSLKELENEFPTIGDVNANCVMGGYGWGAMNDRMSNGSWYGGFVDDWGYVSEVCTVGQGNQWGWSTINGFNHTTGNTQGQVLENTVISNIPWVGAAYGVYGVIGDLLKSSYDRQVQDAVNDLMNSGHSMNEEISWSTNNGVDVYDNSGNHIWP